MRSASARRIASRFRARPSSYVCSDMLGTAEVRGYADHSTYRFRPLPSNRRANRERITGRGARRALGGSSLDLPTATDEDAGDAVGRRTRLLPVPAATPER